MDDDSSDTMVSENIFVSFSLRTPTTNRRSTFFPRPPGVPLCPPQMPVPFPINWRNAKLDELASNRPYGFLFFYQASQDTTAATAVKVEKLPDSGSDFDDDDDPDKTEVPGK